jgi:lysophospholipase L1-like esterase
MMSVLNDLLTADNGGMPVTVLNEGNPGEAIVEAASRIDAVLERTPEAQAYLTIFGANDVGAPLDSGLGLYTGDPGYAGSFKDHMQQIIDAVLLAGKQIILGKAPPRLDDAGPAPSYDATIQEFNQVIDELVSDNGFSYTPPDFHAYLTANSVLEMNADNIHPNGIGYQSMANLWCTAINGITELPGVLCSP